MRGAQRHDLHQDIIDQLPHLRAFAILLTRDRSFADDLVQDAVMRALAHADQFRPGTNFKAWITTILRNSFFNVVRHSRRVAPMTAVTAKHEPITSGGQEEHLELKDFERVFKGLPSGQREALLLVGASGFSYEAAAEIAECAVGTMKSRVARGRVLLTKMLSQDSGGPGRQSVGDCSPSELPDLRTMSVPVAWTRPARARPIEATLRGH